MADAINDKIGFPAFILNRTALDERYKDLEVKENEYFLNNLRDQRYTMKRNLNKLRKKSDKNSWSMTPATVNAYYQPTKNEIVFPAGILQSPFYDQLYPQSLKFGSMGVVMGHELTHAFDDQGKGKFGIMGVVMGHELTHAFNDQGKFGSMGVVMGHELTHAFDDQGKFGIMGVVMGHELTHAFNDQGREYDKYGTLRRWWTNSSIEHFNERTQCIVQQYSSYKIGKDNIRGKQTLGENIADNGGLKSAYHAYDRWIGRNGEEKPLPGLNYTHRQLFFIAFSQVWCSHNTPEADHLSILTDPHSLPKFRVIGSLANSHDFSQQFKCKKGDAMYVKDKTCNVW
ncbi:Endothelin-converting enzyme 1 [Lamellibrachia satsuma]|nr:Endothelin-converting enzyme 1 [Lamellibrachia satsuma]